MNRTTLGAAMLAILALWPACPTRAQTLIQIDRAAQLARADLDYDTPAARSEEGMPIGNGRMGTLVWTTPSALKMQINRVDVHAMDSTTFSFPRADSDYGYGCAFVDINVVQSGDDVFAGESFHQHLSLHDAVMTAKGNGVTARSLAWPDGDVIAIEIDDDRAQPEPIDVHLRMLRYQMQYTPGRSAELAKQHAVVFHTGAHSATSTLGIRDGRITLVQQFQEGEFYDSSAVAIAVLGRQSRARYLNDMTVQVSAVPGKGPFTILIGSAASADPAADTAALALSQVRIAEEKGFSVLQQDTSRWWHEFWNRGGVYLHSASGQADLVEANYNTFLYLMAASSRGDFPPRFGGLLWLTNGDLSRWGSQYWWANTSAYYSNLMPSNRLELIDPMFELYAGMYDAAALAARQQWGTEGIWIPETTFFNGPEKLPEDIARELQDLVLARKPFAERSERFDRYVENKNRHTSRWNFRADGKWEEGRYAFAPKNGIFGHTTHILGVAARVANLAWQRYQFTGDQAWLRDHAYSFIRGAAEFYRSFPNLQADHDGVYHINHTNSGESAWDSRDAPYEVACMHMILPLAVRAAVILRRDAELRAKWQHIADHLVPIPPRAQCGTGSEIAIDRPYGAFVYNGPGAIEPVGPEPELKRRFLGFTRLGSFIDADGGGGAQIFRNRLRLREGPGAIDAEHIAGLASGVHASLLNSHPESTTEEPIRIFNAWPKDWDAAFTLLARGGFVVSSAQRAGKTPLVEAVSQNGGTFRIVNPWPGQSVTLYRSGREADHAAGDVVAFATAKGETIVLAPKGTTAGAVKALEGLLFPSPRLIKRLGPPKKATTAIARGRRCTSSGRSPSGGCPSCCSGDRPSRSSTPRGRPGDPSCRGCDIRA